MGVGSERFDRVRVEGWIVLWELVEESKSGEGRVGLVFFLGEEGELS